MLIDEEIYYYTLNVHLEISYLVEAPTYKSCDHNIKCYVLHLWNEKYGRKSQYLIDFLTK